MTESFFTVAEFLCSFLAALSLLLISHLPLAYQMAGMMCCDVL